MAEKQNNLIVEWLKQMALRMVCLRRDAEGFVLMSTLAIFLLLFVFCASIYAIGETIHQRVKLQNACDAAAYSAAVIQADGLSRMASINRAMSWTYVQMTNRQMDYITYRWLRLTCTQFDEDLENAKNFSECLVLPIDKEATWVGMLIEGIVGYLVAGGLSCFNIDLVCGGNGDHYTHGKKGGEGLAYWCGRDGGLPGHGLLHEIELNNDPPNFDLSMSGAFETATKELLQHWITKDNIEKVLNMLSPVLGNNAENLGELIDWDKTNIEMMNNALPMINELMTLSMKVSSENILKASLKDRRMENSDILNDYHISIKIPHAGNPYDVEEVTQATNSYFSALHNTEADEMLFLNMHSKEDVSKTLPAHFPVLGGGSLAYGLDQWFIRGRGIYENSDNETACYMGQDGTSYKNGKSGWVDGDENDESKRVRLLATERSDGNGGLDLGIQRVYKDANLNETGAGAFMRRGHEEKVLESLQYSKSMPNKRAPRIGELNEWYIGVSNKDTEAEKKMQEWKSSGELPNCCKEHLVKRVVTNTGPYMDEYHKGDGSNWKKKGGNATYIVEIVVENHKKSSNHPVSRGNHIVNLMGLLDTASAIMKSMGSDVSNQSGSAVGQSDGEEEDDGLIEIADLSDYDSQISTLDGEIDDLSRQLEEDPENEALRNQLREKKEMREALQNDRSTFASGDVADTSVNGGGASSSSGQSSGGGVFDALLGLLTDFFNALLGDVLDVQASCGNNNALDYKQYPMCSKASNTYALYSQYRWGSAKWYCFTCMKAYILCPFFCDHKGIWCDMDKHKIPIARFFKTKARGKGHWHVPKWFCAGMPTHPGDQFGLPASLSRITDNFLKYFIPLLIPPTDLEGKLHGYMKTTGDLENLIWPAGQFTGSVSRIERDEFETCVPFFGVPSSVTPIGAAYASVIQGHTRIYGDDKRIFDNRYVGAKCKPWVLNERFFSWDGTIIAGAAMKHRNPFVQLFDFLNREYTRVQNMPEHSMLSAFNIPDGNVMWTMSASRAGVRRHRRNGLYDQERQYQITYDSTSDVENLYYSSGKGPYYFLPNRGTYNSGSWEPINTMSTTDAWGCDSNNPLALSRPDISGQKVVAVWNGCPCAGDNTESFSSINTESFSSMWNLCEWDWDATLIPLRYAGAYGRLQLVEEDGRPLSFAGKHLDELCHEDRKKAIGEMRNTSSDSENLKSEELRALAQNDDYMGDGRHWTWQMDKTLFDLNYSWDRDAFCVMAWKPATSTFFGNVASTLAQGNVGAAQLNNLYQGVDLRTRLPRMKEGEADDAEMRYNLLLRTNRIL